MDDNSHSLMILAQSVQRSSSALFSGDIPAAAAASWKLLPDVIEICEVSDERREWPLWSELRDLASVSISLE